MNVILLISLIIFCGFNWRALYFEPKWQLLAWIAAAILSFKIAAVSSWQFGLLYFYLAFSAILFGAHDFFASFEVALEVEGAKSSISIFAAGIVFLFFDFDVYPVLPGIIIFNALFKLIPVKYRRIKDPAGRTPPMQGLGGNVSADSTLMSIIYAMTLFRDYPFGVKEITFGAMIFILAWNKTSAGALAFATSFFLYLVFNGQYVPALLGLGAAISIAYRYRETLLSGSGREGAWRFMLKYLWKNAQYKFFGLGNGMFRVWMPFAQDVRAKEFFEMQEKWIGDSWAKLYDKGTVLQFRQAHNDILQFFIESGYLGVFLLGLFLASIVPNFTPEHWCVFSAIAINAFFNFPFHLAPDNFFILIALKDFYKN